MMWPALISHERRFGMLMSIVDLTNVTSRSHHTDLLDGKLIINASISWGSALLLALPLHTSGCLLAGFGDSPGIPSGAAVPAT